MPVFKADGDRRLPRATKWRSPFTLKWQKTRKFSLFLTYNPKSQSFNPKQCLTLHRSYTYITHHINLHHIINFTNFIEKSCTIDKPSRIETKGIIRIQSKIPNLYHNPIIMQPLRRLEPHPYLRFSVL